MKDTVRGDTPIAQQGDVERAIAAVGDLEFVTEIPADFPQAFSIGRIRYTTRGSTIQWLVPGRDMAFPPRKDGPLTMYQCALDYLQEHCTKSGVDLQRAWGALEDWIAALGHDRDVSTLKRADGRLVVERVAARGCTSATAGRILTFGIAALNHARKEERIAKVPTFQKPARAEPRLRWLSREEHRRLMQSPMPPRLYRFFLLAFATGARSRAIEQLTWDRVDLAKRTIDYRLPNTNHKNKRRAVVPISDALLPRLEAMHARRTDNYVIGLGPRGRVSSTYHQARAALKRIGIDQRGVARHVARHTFASWLLQADPPASIHQVAQLMGDTVAMVERTYAHLLPSNLLAPINRLH